MDKPPRVGGVERPGHLLDDTQGTRRRERPFGCSRRLQVGALDQRMAMYSRPSTSPASWIGTTFGCSSDAARRDSRRNRSRNETSSARSGAEQLQCDVTVEREVVGAIDDPHPPAAEQLLDPVAGEFTPDGQVNAYRHGRFRRPDTRASCCKSLRPNVHENETHR